MTHEDALQASIAEIIADFFYATARGRLSHSQEINARNAAHLVWQRLEAEGQTNRWAAFTNDELHEIHASLDMLWQWHTKSPTAQRVWDEITDELANRSRIR